MLYVRYKMRDLSLLELIHEYTPRITEVVIVEGCRGVDSNGGVSRRICRNNHRKDFAYLW